MIHRRIDADILATINYDAVRGMTPSQIQRELARDMALRGRMPTLRTIQRIVADTIGRDDSGEWHLAPEGPDPAAVLWVLAASLRDGWKVPISEAEAGWLRTIHRAAPELGPLTVRYLARLYLAAAARGEPTTLLDAALAIGPWRGASEREAYDALGLPHLPFAMTQRQALR